MAVEVHRLSALWRVDAEGRVILRGRDQDGERADWAVGTLLERYKQIDRRV